MAKTCGITTTTTTTKNNVTDTEYLQTTRLVEQVVWRHVKCMLHGRSENTDSQSMYYPDWLPYNRLTLKNTISNEYYWKTRIDYILNYIACTLFNFRPHSHMRLRVRFYGQIRKRILESQNRFCVFFAKSKNGSWIQRIHTRGAFFLGTDLKKVFFTSGFPCKNDTQQLPYVTV